MIIITWPADGGFPAGAITIGVRAFDRVQEEDKRQIRSLSGVMETSLLFSLQKYSINTVPLSGADLDDFRDFVGATKSGLSYKITDVDTGAEIDVITEGTPQQNRHVSSSINYYTYSWVARPI